MLSIRKINPMVRAIGTMGVVAGLVGAVTFANLASAAVVLGPNDFTTATASLAIETSGCNVDSLGTRAPGFTDTLVPGQATTPVPFCIENTSDIPLTVTVGIDQTQFTGASGVLPSDITLNINCDVPGSSSGTLDAYTGGTSLGTLPAGTSTACTATAELSASYSNPSGNTLPPFDISFVGNQ